MGAESVSMLLFYILPFSSSLYIFIYVMQSTFRLSHIMPPEQKILKTQLFSNQIEKNVSV